MFVAMPTSVVIECMLVIVAAAAVGVGTFRWVRRTWAATLLAGLSLLWLVIDAFWLSGSVALLRWFRWRDFIVLANFTPFAAATLAAVMLRLSKGPWVVRSAFAAILVLACLYQAYGGLFRAKPHLNPRWKNGVCMQSSEASCSAAAAATFLTIHGIPATEQEMAELCFTTDQGTSMQGIYRGLVIKSFGTPWRVEPVTGRVEQLAAANAPTLLSVGLGRWQVADPRYSRDWGWAPGTLHSVVFLGTASDNKVDMADPKVGREQWMVQGLADLWKGEGLRLVPR